MKKRNNSEKAARLTSAVGGIGDDLIKEAEEYRAEKKIFAPVRRHPAISAIAAVLAIAMIVPAMLFLSPSGSEITTLKRGAPIAFTNKPQVADGVTELPEELREVSVYAENSTGHLIDNDESLIMETAGDTDAGTVSKYLSVSPEIPLSVTRIDERKFEIKPAAGTFYSGEIVKLTLGDKENPAISYTFQSVGKLLVKSFLPADKAENVPIGTGIELTFSEAAEQTDFEDFVSISPEISGSFMLYPDGKTLAFVPEKPLEYDTIYTVTVKSGIKALSGKTSDSEKVFMFRTEKEEGKSGHELYLSSHGITDLSAVFSEGENAKIDISCSSYGLEVSGTAALYKFPAYDDAYKKIKAYLSGEELTADDLTEVEGSKKELSFAHSYKASADFGASLESGIYLVKIDATARDGLKKRINSTLYGFIQVTPLRSFTYSSDGKLLLWLNDKNGKNISDAAVTGDAFDRYGSWACEKNGFTVLSGNTASDGTLSLDIGENNAVCLLVHSGEDSLICAYSAAQTDTEKYYAGYIYTDRETYFTTDTVNLWGFVTPKYGTVLPDEVYLMTGLSDKKTKMELTPEGLISGKLEMYDVVSGGIFVRVVDSDENTVVSKYIEVTDEEKPVITAAISFDRPYYTYGDKVKATLKATFFDGTPAPGFDFWYNEYVFDTSGTGTTDENGEFTFTVKAGYNYSYSTDPVSVCCTAELCDTEAQELRVSSDFVYFCSDYSYGITYTDNEPVLTLHKWDFSKLDGVDTFPWEDFPENVMGDFADGSVSYKIKKYTLIKTEKTRYDTYLKQNYTYYDYSTVEEVVETGTYGFKNGKITLPLYDAAENENFVITATFSDGRASYEIATDVTKRNDDSRIYWSYIYGYNDGKLVLNQEKYILGDTVTANMTKDAAFADNALFAVFGNGLCDYHVGESYTARYTDEFVGSSVFAAYYDTASGKFVNGREALVYDYEKNGVSPVTVTADKETYLPGESATVKIKSDIPSANVLLSVVDEACFALGAQNADPAEYFNAIIGGRYYNSFSEYYLYDYFMPYYGNTSGTKPVYTDMRLDIIGIVYADEGYNYGLNRADTEAFKDSDMSLETKTSEAPDDRMDESAGKTEDGSDSYYVRRAFSDNPVFLTATLDENGEAAIKFTVPDNITSWRATALSVSGTDKKATDITVGAGVSSVICTKDYFVLADMTKTFVLGDDIVLSARSYGKAANGKAEYTAMLKTDDGDTVATLSKKGECGEYTRFNFGKADIGDYTITVYGKCKGAKDAVETAIVVTDSVAMTEISKEITADEISSLDIKRFPLTLTFCDGAGGGTLFDRVLSALSFRDSSARADALAAKYVSLGISAKRYGGASSEDELTLTGEEMTHFGVCFASLLPYSEEDIVLTSEILSLCPEVFSPERRSEIKENCLSLISSAEQTDETELSAALLCLASLDEGILDTLYNVGNTAADYNTEAKLLLSAAFAVIGDYGAANDIYMMLREDAKENPEYSELSFGKGTLDEIIRATSLSVLTSARINRTDAQMAVEYLLSNVSRATSPDIALATYLRFFRPTDYGNEKTVTYTVGGETFEKTVNVISPVTVRLTRREYETFSLGALPEGITVRADYYGALTDAAWDTSESGRVKISKKMEDIGNGFCKVTLTVSGTSERVSEMFDISDCIPTGARFFESRTDGYGYKRSGGISTSIGLWEKADGNISGYVSVYNEKANKADGIYTENCPEYSFETNVSYVIRSAAAGEFVSPAAYLTNTVTNSASVSEKYTVNIDDGGEWSINLSD